MLVFVHPFLFSLFKQFLTMGRKDKMKRNKAAAAAKKTQVTMEDAKKAHNESKELQAHWLQLDDEIKTLLESGTPIHFNPYHDDYEWELEGLWSNTDIQIQARKDKQEDLKKKMTRLNDIVADFLRKYDGFDGFDEWDKDNMDMDPSTGGGGLGGSVFVV